MLNLLICRCPSVRPFVRPSVLSTVRLYVRLYVRPSVCLSGHPPVSPSVCLFVCLSQCLCQQSVHFSGSSSASISVRLPGHVFFYLCLSISVFPAVCPFDHVSITPYLPLHKFQHRSVLLCWNLHRSNHKKYFVVYLHICKSLRRYYLHIVVFVVLVLLSIHLNVGLSNFLYVSLTVCVYLSDCRSASISSFTDLPQARTSSLLSPQSSLPLHVLFIEMHLPLSHRNSTSRQSEQQAYRYCSHGAGAARWTITKNWLFFNLIDYRFYKKSWNSPIMKRSLLDVRQNYSDRRNIYWI